MANDVEKTLYCILKTTEFSLQTDNFTLPRNEALLLAYVRSILSLRTPESGPFRSQDANNGVIYYNTGATGARISPELFLFSHESEDTLVILFVI